MYVRSLIGDYTQSLRSQTDSAAFVSNNVCQRRLGWTSWLVWPDHIWDMFHMFPVDAVGNVFGSSAQ